MATDRHVSEPWYGIGSGCLDIRRGATPSLEKLIAFFPGSPTPFELTPTAVSAHSDLAILHVSLARLRVHWKHCPWRNVPRRRENW